jgi:hypothetical protein
MLDFSKVPSLLPTIIIHLGEAILIFIAGRWLARLFRSWVSRPLSRTTITPSSAELACPFVRPGGYFAALGDLIERIRLRFDQEGIAMTVQQRDVRVVTHEPAP